MITTHTYASRRNAGTAASPQRPCRPDRPVPYRGGTATLLPTGTVGPATTRVFTALLTRVAAGHTRHTCRDLARDCGLALSVVHHHLRKLRTAGLVAWEDGLSATLRPAVEVVAC